MTPVQRADLEEYLRQALADPSAFSRLSAGMCLRSYQQEVAAAVIDSVLRQKGLSFVVMFPRQSGKNELQAHLEAYLLTLSEPLGLRDGEDQSHLEAAEPERHAAFGARAEEGAGDANPVGKGKRLHLPRRAGQHLPSSRASRRPTSSARPHPRCWRWMKPRM